MDGNFFEVFRGSHEPGDEIDTEDSGAAGISSAN